MKVKARFKNLFSNTAPGTKVRAHGHDCTVQADQSVVVELDRCVADYYVKLGWVEIIEQAPVFKPVVITERTSSDSAIVDDKVSFDSYGRTGDLEKLRDQITRWRRGHRKAQLVDFADKNFGVIFPPNTTTTQMADEVLAIIDARCDAVEKAPDAQED